ncbi:MAG: glycosyltransferase [Acidimicrobiia bacterium]|nr:MAG: glycosyltransferase [Acidimicrobiia bacterium]
MVYLPTWARWDEMRQRPQYLLAAFARAGHPVYFVDPRERGPRTADGVHLVPDLSHVPGRDVILYVHFAPVSSMFGLFENPVLVYDILDDLSIYDADESGMPAERRVAHHHPSVVAAADVVTVSSDSLAEQHRSERPDLIVVPNGVEPERFVQSYPRPFDMPNGAGPVIGYHGAVAPWFDFDLYTAAASLLSDCRFVLIGPVDPRVSEEAKQLASLPNVSLLDPKPSDVIPRYVQHFDVGTVPFVVDPMTRGVSPLKMYEYFAAGKPCVATPLPACVTEPMARTASDADRFAAAVREALDDSVNPAFVAKARDTAAGASWDGRVSMIRARLDELGLLRSAP